MSESLYSTSWYRVAALKPRLGAHAHIFRQMYRGQLWYVLQDRGSGRYNRFTPAAYLVISLMDGQRTVQEIWDTACVELGANVPTQGEMVNLLSQLHQTDALHADVTPNIARVSDRVRKVRWRKILLSMANPMAIRIPLLDPDRFLNVTMPILRPLYSWPAALAFVVFVSYSFLVAASHWREITADITDHVLAAESLLLMLITYPFVKALHELGHAYAVKRWGGEVHEIGIMFLVFTPVPYVDASASSSFPQKWRRAFVAMAGIAVELVLAGIALQVWLNTGEGLFRAFAFNVMFIGGVSTLLVNGNPLLRFDGYYALSDIIEVPNLAIRANRYIGYLIQRYGFGVRTVESPVAARGEAVWLACYAVASFIYRLTVVLSITLFVASRYFIVGVILAIWGVVMMIVVPIGKQVNFLFTSPALRERRRRAFGVTGAAMAAIAVFLLLVPLPYSTIATGVMWIPGDAIIHARTEGTVVRLLQVPGVHVATGEPVLQLEDPLLEAKVRAQEAKTEGLRLRYAAAAVKDAAEAQIAVQSLRHAEADLALLREHQRDLVVHSPNHGRFVVPQPNDLVGGFVHKGDILGYVLRGDFSSVHVIVDEESADLVRRSNTGVELRLAHQPEMKLWGIVVREVPMFSDRLPSMALSTAGGGEVAMDPTNSSHARALAKLLQFEIGLAEELPAHAFGERVFVRFRHDNEALAFRLYRMARQLVMSRLNV